MIITITYGAFATQCRVALLDDRIKDAQVILDRRTNDSVEVRIELAGYLRGIRDAQSAIRMRKD